MISKIVPILIFSRAMKCEEYKMLCLPLWSDDQPLLCCCCCEMHEALYRRKDFPKIILYLYTLSLYLYLYTYSFLLWLLLVVFLLYSIDWLLAKFNILQSNCSSITFFLFIISHVLQKILSYLIYNYVDVIAIIVTMFHVFKYLLFVTKYFCVSILLGLKISRERKCRQTTKQIRQIYIDICMYVDILSVVD